MVDHDFTSAPAPDPFHDDDDELVGDVSPLELLAKAVTEEVRRDDVVWQIPDRPGFRARYSAHGLNPDRYQKLGRRARTKRGDLNIDQQACLMLAEFNSGLEIDGTWVTENGTPLTFTSSGVRQALGADTAADAVRVFYGGPSRDYGFAIQRHHNELLALAGLTVDTVDEDDEPDPTKGRER